VVDVARLQVEVDSRDVRKAEDNFDRFTRSGRRAERQTKSVGGQAQRTARAMQGMNRSVKLLTGAMGALTAALSVRALQQFVVTSVNAVDQIGKAAQTAGIAAEELQELRFAFSQLAGTTDREVDQSIRRFNRRLGLAIDGGGAAKDTFDDLNISLRNTSGNARSSEAVLNDLLIALGGVEDSSRRAALASQAFGEDAGPRLAAALDNGVDSLRSARQEARDLGLVLSDETVAAGEDLADQFDILSRQIGVQLQTAVIENKDAILDLVGAFTDLLDAASQGNLLPDFFADAKSSASGFVQELEKARNIILALAGVKAGATAGRIGGPIGAVGGGIAGGILGFNAADIVDSLASTRDGAGGTRTGTATSRLPLAEGMITGPEELTNVNLVLEEIVKNIDRAPEKTNAFAGALESVGDSLREVEGTIEDGIGNALEDMILRGEEASDVFKRLAADIATAVLRQKVIDPFAQQATSALLGLFPGGAGSTSVGGGASPNTRGIGPQGFANGGNVSGDVPIMVGERGPELFVPRQDGQIVPNHQMGGGDVTVNIINQGGEQLEAQQKQTRRGPNGEQTVDVMVKSSMERLDSQGQLDGIFRRHGAARQGQF